MLSLKSKEHEMLLKRGEHIDVSDLIKAPVCDGTREERLQSLLRVATSGCKNSSW